jgi:hypothetical protein
MKRRSAFFTKILAIAVATTGVLLVPAGRAAAVPSACTINVTAGTHNCTGVPGITIMSLTGGRLLVKLTIVAGNTAHITATYNATPTGYSVNIGDSLTNNGGGGDAGTQSNDAEMQIQTQTLSTFGRDGTVTYPLFTVPNAALANGSIASFEVSDRKLCWNFANYTCSTSDQLYALAGQADTQGSVNQDIYASFNRVITGDATRNGTGVTSVTVSAS